MYPVSEEFQTKILAPERRVLGKVEIEYWRKFTTVKHYDPSVVFTGDWILDYHNIDHHSNTAGDYVEITFTGVGVQLERYITGIVDIYIDDQYMGRTEELGMDDDHFAPIPLHDGKLENGEHVLRLVVLGGETVYDMVYIGGFIVETEFVETYTGDDLFLIDILEEREDVESGSMPVGNISAGEIDIRLDNSERKFDPGNTNSPLYGLLKKGLKVRAWLGAELDSGEQEWVPMGVFYTLSWSASESDLYCHVTARDRLDQLRETDYTTSKAIVAPAALPKPVFTRASTAYKEDGTQVAVDVPRYGDKGILIEKGTKNLRPGWPDEWTVSSGATVMGMGTEAGIVGTIMRITNPLAAERYYTSAKITLSPDTTYTLSFKARGTVGPGKLDAFVLSHTGETIQGRRIAIGPSGDFQRYGVTFTTTSDITSGQQYIRFDHNGNDSGHIDLAEVQLEEGTRTSYTFAGDTNVRAGEGLTIPCAGVLDTAEGTIDIRVDVNEGMLMNDYPNRNTFRRILYHQTEKEGQVISNQFGLSCNTYPDYESYWEFWTSNGGQMLSLSASDILSVGKHIFTMRWKLFDERFIMSFAIDGVIKDEIIGSADDLKVCPTFLNDICWIGCHTNGTEQANAYINEIRFSSKYRSDEEVLAYGATPDLNLPHFDITLYMGMDGDLTVQPDGIRLYDLAENILIDAGLTANEYYIDSELQNTLLTTAFLEPQSHREALRKTAEAGLAVVYCDREDGRIRIKIPETPTVEDIEETLYIQGAAFPAEIETAQAYGVSADDYFRKDHPEGKLGNQIFVTSQPLVPGQLKRVYESIDPIHLETNEEKTVTIFYDESPCINAQIDSSEGTTILSVTQYTWGANVTLSNTSWPVVGPVDAIITVNARPLEVRGKVKVFAKDNESIAENGLQGYSFPDNPLVQSRDVAQMIADNLLAVYAPARRNVELDWRGNPALELGDVVVLPEYQRDGIDARGYYVVVQQEFEWDGGLRAKLVGVKVPDAE